MYFAGDGFSEIKAGVDTLTNSLISSKSFDVVAANPPYGQYHEGRIEEAFLKNNCLLKAKGRMGLYRTSNCHKNMPSLMLSAHT